VDTDADGLCDLGDADDDNDGITDPSDTDPLDPNVCADADGDTCDDCAVGTDGFGPLADNDPDNDGTDTDGDGACDLGDADDDNDGVDDLFDNDPLDPFACRDEDSDTCDDCSSGTDDPANDGTDTDSDGLCDLGDPDDDNDGVADAVDCRPLDSQNWALPDRVLGLTLQHSAGTTLISWSAPTTTGTSVPLQYDTIRSNDPADFVSSADCIDPNDSNTESSDGDLLSPGALAVYLVRPENGCGQGPTGADSVGQPRVVLNCP